MINKRFFAGCLAMLLTLPLWLAGCASSEVSRQAASNVDMGVQNAKNLANGIVDGGIADSYQNASQATKGAIIAGSAGALTATTISGVGTIAGAAVGAVLGMSYGSYLDANSSLQDKLINRGANIIILGDQVMIVLPSARLFNPMSPQLKKGGYSTLNMVAKYVNHFDKILVKVGSYTSRLGSERVNLALSKQQASNVAKYLMTAGIDARVLYSEGYGSTKPVTNFSQEWSSDNYRVEITLEKLPA